MKKIFSLLLIAHFFNSTATFAQEFQIIEQETVTDDIIVKAAPRIGIPVFIQNLTTALKHPKFDRAILSDTLTFKFIIDEKGQMPGLIMVDTKIKNSFYEQDILSIFYSLSKWKPAIKNGQPMISENTIQFVPRKTKKRN